jgi:hypothetical protein
MEAHIFLKLGHPAWDRLQSEKKLGAALVAGDSGRRPAARRPAAVRSGRRVAARHPP